MKKETNVGNDGFMFDHNSTIPPTERVKQTAVEYLLSELEIDKLIDREKLTIAAEIVGRAKQMEKEQILEFTRNAVRKILDEDRQNPFNLEQYYNETYK